jgi:glutamine---fructose-6-phosphate transaminase (isomerizing)
LSSANGVRGAHMAAEIAQQPAAWRRLIARGMPAIDAVAGEIRAARPRFVVFAARGTSDHAALYAKYLTEIVLQLPAGLASPSTVTVYGARPRLDGVLIVAVSQSGGSPDLVKTVSVARDCGGLTVAVTNNPNSPLARAAEHHVDILAGPELAVAATKSYTSQLLALYLLLTRVAGGSTDNAAALLELAERALDEEDLIAELAQRYRFATRLVTTGRGYSYPTACEAALKLMETSYLSAQAFSGADLLHGPQAMIDSTVPVLAIVSPGIGGAAMSGVLKRIGSSGADVCCIGEESAVRHADVGIVLPGPIDERLSPLLEILPVQQLAFHLALARGHDPDRPRGLAKVTETY